MSVMFDVIYVLASDVLYVMWFVLVIRQSLSSSLASTQFRVGQQFEGPVTSFTFYLFSSNFKSCNLQVSSLLHSIT